MNDCHRLREVKRLHRAKDVVQLQWKREESSSTRISSDNLRSTTRSLTSYAAPFASMMVMMSFLPPVSALLNSFARVPRGASLALALLVVMICPGCVSSAGRIEPVEDPPIVADTAPAPLMHDVPMAASGAKSEGDSEVPVAVAESEQHEAPPKPGDLPELIVKGRTRDVVIRDLVAEGGIPVGAALFNAEGRLLGKGHNRRIQDNDPSAHGETDAFRKAGRLRSYRDTIMATTLAPCWYCSGLIVQFNIGTVVIGESVNFQGGIDWLRERGVRVIDLQSDGCIQLLAEFVDRYPGKWYEDIGKDD